MRKLAGCTGGAITGLKIQKREESRSIYRSECTIHVRHVKKKKKRTEE
jgi:hypothetical protein